LTPAGEVAACKYGPHLVGAHGPAEEVALELLAAAPGQELRLLQGLYSLRHY
jgi:hypothetical protein